MSRIGGGDRADCHAGESPFIVHPSTNLDLMWDTATRDPRVSARNYNAKNWYDPLFDGARPQNPGPTNAINKAPTGAGQIPSK